MGLIVSVLFSYVGAVELVFIIRDVVHQIALHQRRLQENDEDLDDGLLRMQDALRKSISVARRRESDNVQCMQDGVQYENGYRVDSVSEDWIEVRRAIERGQQDGAGTRSSPDGRRSVESGGSRTSHSPDQSSNSYSHASANTVIETNAKANGKSKHKSSNQDIDPTDRSSSPEAADMHFDAYSESYLRSLDGIKMRPLVRDDGNRRRRAFKKSQSGSSNSSAVSSSREEELKMFTSLEEEEFEAIRKSDYKPLQYSSEPNLKANHHTRRHKRSPVQDLNRRNSDIIDEIPDPWGDVKPEHFHDTELWKKERALSIAETDDDHSNSTNVPSRNKPKTDDQDQDAETSQVPDFDRCYSPVGKKYTKMSSFEEASGADHTRAINLLRAQTSNDDVTPAADEHTKPHPNVSMSADLPTNQIAIDNASANANALNEMESFACDPELPSNSLAEGGDIRIEAADGDFSTTNDMNTIITDDGKIEEFMNYIQKLDRKQSDDRLEFKEYADQSKRIRYPSYNYDAKEIDELDFNVDSEIFEAFDEEEDNAISGDANQTSLNGERTYETLTRSANNSALDDQRLALRKRQEEADRLNSNLNPYAKSFDYRKRTTDYENISSMQDDEADSKTPDKDPENQDVKDQERETIKRVKKIDDLKTFVENSIPLTKGLNPSESEVSINEIDFVFVESSDLNDETHAYFDDLSSIGTPTNEKSSMKPPRSASYAGRIIDSSSLENINVRKESLGSNQSSESSDARKAAKLPYTSSSSSMSYAREDSWISMDSNTCLRRSPSRNSDLEYIKGRDDWRDISNYRVEHEIDSDDYHHHRRHSETADTLEYIRGRDDWIRYEETRERGSTLPQIYESEGQIGIKEETDADEYHHHRRLSEIISYAHEASNLLFIAQGSARSGRERSPYKVLRADIDKAEFIKRYYWKGGNEPTPDISIDRAGSTSYEEPINSKSNYAEERLIQSERYIWIAENKRSRSKSPFAVSITIEDSSNGCGNETQIIIPSTSSGSTSNMIDVSVVTTIGSEPGNESTVQIQEVIDNISDTTITVRESNKNMDNIITDAIKTSADENIEVVVVNLKKDRDGFDEPIIVITEVPDECAPGISRSVSREPLVSNEGLFDLPVATQDVIDDKRNDDTDNKAIVIDTEAEFETLDISELECSQDVAKFTDETDSNEVNRDLKETPTQTLNEEQKKKRKTKKVAKDENITSIHLDEKSTIPTNSTISIESIADSAIEKNLQKDMGQATKPSSQVISTISPEQENLPTIENQVPDQSEQAVMSQTSNKPPKSGEIVSNITTQMTTSSKSIEKTEGTESETASSSKSSEKPDEANGNTKRRGSTKRRKSRKSIHGDNLEDLIQEGSLGPWFHK